MAKKLFEVDIPKGTRLDVSKELDGAFRGTLRSNKSNTLVGHANLVEVVRATTGMGGGLSSALVGVAFAGLSIAATAGISRLTGSHSRRRREAMETEYRERELAAADAERLREEERRKQAELEEDKEKRKFKRQAKRKERRARREEREARRTRRRVRKWEERTAQEKFNQVMAAAKAPKVLPVQLQWRPGWYDDGSGRWRWWDGAGWANQSKPMAAPNNLPEHFVPQQSVVMSSAEWQARVQAMLLARAFSDEQMRLLANARISHASEQVLEAQRDLQKMTSNELSTRINGLLNANPALQRAVGGASAPGWYNDGNNRKRWWNGSEWTEHVQATRAQPRQLPRGHTVAPGWYPDSQGNHRWWDGTKWTDHVRQQRVPAAHHRAQASRPGWYTDATGRRRWWDGQCWT